MTLALFIALVSILSLTNSLITQAIKISFNITKPTLVVAIVSAITGWIGGFMAYILLGIDFTPSNIVCLILLAPTCWLTATLGYDKVMKVITEIKIFNN